MYLDDETRVVLLDRDPAVIGSDYINANYISVSYTLVYLYLWLGVAISLDNSNSQSTRLLPPTCVFTLAEYLSNDLSPG